jgi:stearoyl-CoA desaturase (delta-9 desaturase)
MNRFNQIITALAFASLLLLVYYCATSGTVTWLIFSYLYYKIVVGLLGNQIAQHRYFSHKGFVANGFKKYLLYFSTMTTGVNPIFYAVMHRHHHIHSDTAADLHSWKNTIWDIFSPATGITSYKGKIKYSTVLDNDLKPFHKWYNHIMIAAIVGTALISWKVAVFLLLSGIAWNYIHMILFRVWLVHVKLPGSYQTFDTGDHSWNNRYIQILDLGEGLHNNHHQYPNRYDQAVLPGEFDPAAWVIDKFIRVKNG